MPQPTRWYPVPDGYPDTPAPCGALLVEGKARLRPQPDRGGRHQARVRADERRGECRHPGGAVPRRPRLSRRDRGSGQPRGGRALDAAGCRGRLGRGPVRAGDAASVRARPCRRRPRHPVRAGRAAIGRQAGLRGCRGLGTPCRPGRLAGRAGALRLYPDLGPGGDARSRTGQPVVPQVGGRRLLAGVARGWGLPCWPARTSPTPSRRPRSS